jgi:hypothetical protein
MGQGSPRDGRAARNEQIRTWADVADRGAPDFSEADADVIAPANPTLSVAPRFCVEPLSSEFHFPDL